ncbi:phosphatidate cytidylyltransferase [Desulfonatronospira sp.]|uniref:phosphatidate cytidylyltransferase n=1 Tax=Desulfonatronospira sp. TaxID=1962951 RepID=UPI0025BB95A4|nr:phosphatidate cytidylyltransferase [Desulfonatronospira sp.]
MNLSPHIQRILTAIIIILVLGGAVYFGHAGIAVLVVLVSLLGLWEFYSLFWTGGRRIILKTMGCLAGALFLLDYSLEITGHPLLFLVLVFWAAWLGFLVEYSKQKEQARLNDYMVLISGIAYIPLVLSLFFTLQAPEIILILAATAASDVGAFYSGYLWGDRKIWPDISPKKTWMGSLGGLVLCTAITLGLGTLLGSAQWWHFVILGIILNISAQMGDFFQSSLKRWNDVKDTGQILPGHGGILDRIDSLLLLLPAYVVYSIFVTMF